MRRLNGVVRDRWQNSKAGGRLVAALTLVAALAGPCAAQFSGPAIDLSNAVNRKLTPTTDPAILYPKSREIVLGQGDVLTVHLYGMQDYVPVVRVALDGTIQLPLAGGLSVDGLSLHQAEELIAQRLTDLGMYKNPRCRFN